MILKPHLSISNDIVSITFYDTHDEFDFEIAPFQFLVGDVLHPTSYGVYITQLIRFAASSHFTNFNTRYKHFTQILLKQCYWNPKLRKNKIIANTMI